MTNYSYQQNSFIAWEKIGMKIICSWFFPAILWQHFMKTWGLGYSVSKKHGILSRYVFTFIRFLVMPEMNGWEKFDNKATGCGYFQVWPLSKLSSVNEVSKTKHTNAQKQKHKKWADYPEFTWQSQSAKIFGFSIFQNFYIFQI